MAYPGGGFPDGSAMSYTLPAPTGGWNARDPLHNMPEEDAVELINVFPDGAEVKLRNGYRLHQTAGASNIETIAEYASILGVRTLVAAGGGSIYDVSTYGGSPTTLGSGFLNNRWQTVQFRNRLMMVNGVDQPQQLDTATLSAAVYTGVPDDDKLIHVSAYRNRLYFVEANTTNIWYGGVDSYTGLLTKFDVGSLLPRGGYVLFAGSWTREAGAGATSDLFVIASNIGDVLLYAGDYPGGAWSLQGRFRLPKPNGNRAFVNVGADLAIITEQGVVPLSNVVTARNDTLLEYGKLTDKIGRAFRAIGKTNSSFFGWTTLVHPRGPYLLVNIPIADSTQYEQYVINTETQAWCRFTGMTSLCWALFNEKPYFGSTAGKIYEADVGQNDAGASIPVSIRTAYSYSGDISRVKRFTMARPTMARTSTISFNFQIDTDFATRVPQDTISSVGTGSAWDSVLWDTMPWADGESYVSDWYAVNGLGRSASVRLKGSFLNLGFRISSFNLIYEPGGYL